MISYILPTRDRPECLARTLAALGSLPAHEAEVIVVDNASEPGASVPTRLDNGIPTKALRRERNEGAAARNAGARASEAASEWLVMLDDDSHPMDLGHLRALNEQPADVAAVGAEIFLARTPGGSSIAPALRREAGGLPEVPIGCGVAYRREAFLGATIAGTAGYDPRFGFYAEEYDLAARLILAGHRIVMDRRFAVMHEKTPAGRSMETILRRLVRNNAWVMRRYAPSPVRGAEVRRTMARYARIAWKERAVLGYVAGLAETVGTLHRQPRSEMNAAQWDRFTGKGACRRTLLRAWAERRFESAAIIAPGKNEHLVREALEEMGVRVVEEAGGAEALVVGTLSPGPALNAYEFLASDPRVVAPWPCVGGQTGPIRRDAQAAA
jgi:GT2 family glycosyltransferase